MTTHPFPIKSGDPRPKTEIQMIALPTQGRAEREHLYRWIVEEEGYVAGKFDDQRNGHDDSMREDHLALDGFWNRQIVQYLDRARLFFDEAEEIRKVALGYQSMTDPIMHGKYKKFMEKARHLEMLGQQALVKCMMTSKGSVESSIRCFGPLPKPGLSSGYVEEWT